MAEAGLIFFSIRCRLRLTRGTPRMHTHLMFIATALALVAAHHTAVLAFALAMGCSVSAIVNAPRAKRPLHPSIRKH